MSDGGSSESLTRATELYEGLLKQVVLDFVKSKGLETKQQNYRSADYRERYHEKISILFGTNLSEINFFGIRRQVTLEIDPDKKTVIIDSCAYQDNTGRRLKSFLIAKYPLPFEKRFLPLFQHTLEIAWRISNTITEEDLQAPSHWQEEHNRLHELLVKL
jgi:hypothetical protein